MNKLVLSFVSLTLFFTAAPAHAMILDVTFTPNPLFENTNILPGDVEVGTASVTNTSEFTQTIVTEAVGISDPDNFGDLLLLTINDSTGQLYSDSLASFFASGGVTLGDLNDTESETFEFSVEFINTNDNTFQGKSLGFDLCIGFLGGSLECGGVENGDTTNSNNGGENNSDGEGGSEEQGSEEDSGNDGGNGDGGNGDGDSEGNGEEDSGSGSEGESSGGGSGSGGSGGGGSGSGGGGFIASTPTLNIFDERVTETAPNDGAVRIEWNTNVAATSRVIYGLVKDGPNHPACLTSGPCYNLNLSNTPNYGYPLSTVTDANKVTEHSMLIVGLVPNELYSYRVVSSASPDTASFEHQFILAIQEEEVGEENGGSSNSEEPEVQENSSQPGGFEIETLVPDFSQLFDSNGTTQATSSRRENFVRGGEGGLLTRSTSTEPEANLAAATALVSLPDDFFSFFTSIWCIIVFLLILLGIMLLSVLYFRIIDQEKPKRELLVANILNAIALLVTFFVMPCVTVPLVASQLVFIIWYSLYKD